MSTSRIVSLQIANGDVFRLNLDSSGRYWLTWETKNGDEVCKFELTGKSTDDIADQFAVKVGEIFMNNPNGQLWTALRELIAQRVDAIKNR
jgi:hypothetical protein